MDSKQKQESMEKPKLLLQVCCGPCGAAAFLALCEGYDVTAFFWGNNFDSEEEYERRLQALKVVNKAMNADRDIVIIPYNNLAFSPQHLALEKEGGERCKLCYETRLRAAAEYAKRHGFDAFTTSLTVSPHKNSQVINSIGRRIGEEIGIRFVEVDLKKNNGFQKSVEVSKRLGIYRQKYCGCNDSRISNYSAQLTTLTKFPLQLV